MKATIRRNSYAKKLRIETDSRAFERSISVKAQLENTEITMMMIYDELSRALNNMTIPIQIKFTVEKQNVPGMGHVQYRKDGQPVIVSIVPTSSLCSV